jgi:pyridoxal phosphate enzyme (YggS family)
VDTIEVSERLERVRERIEAAARRAGRRSEDVTLVAVTKGFPASLIAQALDAGLDHLGENRVQEAAIKIPPLRDKATWHLVGHLQRNKAKRALELFDVIESVDSLRLAQELQKRAEQVRNAPVPVLIEVNTSGESTKYGVTPGDLYGLLDEVVKLDRLTVHGLMTVGPIVPDPNDARPAFRRLRELAEGYEGAALTDLSMGMSDDFEVAVEEGATTVRIGTALFGPRPAP